MEWPQGDESREAECQEEQARAQHELEQLWECQIERAIESLGEGGGGEGGGKEGGRRERGGCNMMWKFNGAHPPGLCTSLH